LKRSIVVRLLLLSAAAVTLPALIVSVVQRSISSKALETAIEEKQTEVARRVAADVNNQVRQAQNLIALLARSSSFSAGSRVDQYEALHNLLNANAALQEAMFVSETGEEQVKISQLTAHPELIKRKVDLEHPVIGAPFFSGNRAPTVLISEPVRTFWNPTRRGAVLAKLSFTSLNELLAQTKVGVHGTAFIVNDHGMVLAHPNPQWVYAHTNLSALPVVQRWIQKPGEPTGFSQYSNPNQPADPLIALAYPIPLLRSAVVVQQPKTDVYAPLKRMRFQFILYTVLSVVFFLLIAVALAWRILKPLRALRAAAELIARGERHLKLNIHTKDELEDLGRTFEQMGESIAELETMRSDLVNMVVHDLKVPLSTILPSLECLKNGELGELLPEQKRFVEMAVRASNEMLMMIQNLLDVARLEEGRMKLYPDFFIPGEWADAIVRNFKPLAQANRKQLELVVPDLLPSVRADVALLNRVLSNLILNALRHTVVGEGEVTVTLFQEGQFMSVEVRDNGEGIPEEDQAHLFKKFTQASGHRRNPAWFGTGLGLTFCKMVVEAHGGRIHFFSKPGIGSVFTFHLPIPAETPASMHSLSGLATL
jgi:signal transduction histidine kinase